MKQALRTTLSAIAVVLFALMAFSTSASAFEEDDYVPEATPSAPVFQDTFWYPSAMLTNWKDFGGQQTSESGGLFAFGLTGKLPLPGAFLLRSSGEVFGGHVRFKGNGTGGVLSANGGSDYLGLKVGADLGRSYIGPAMIGFEPFGGLGVRYWHRDIKPGNGNLLERWTSLYARAGLRATHHVSKNTSVFAEGGIAYPVFTRMSASGSLAGTSVSGSFTPNGLISAFAEVGGDVGGFRPSIYYEGFRFDSEGDLTETQGNTVGVRFGVPF